MACKAAYTKCEGWLAELKAYLLENIKFADEFFKINMPKVKMTKPEGTYLLWLDFRKYNLTDKELDNIMLEQAKIWTDSGQMFGKCGKGFQRLNIALPRKQLQIALERMKIAFENN